MPREDRTGPQGVGPQTGRAAGFCAGSDLPGYANPVPGRGRGMRRRGGRGRRNGFRATGLPFWAQRGSPASGPEPTLEEEANALKAQASWLNQQLEAIQKQLNEFEK